MTSGYTESVWKLIMILSLTVLHEEKKVISNRSLFMEWLTIQHSILSTTPMFSLNSVSTCTTPLSMFQAVYEIHASMNLKIASVEQMMEYYIESKDQPIELLTKDVWGPYTWKVIHELAPTTSTPLFIKWISLLFELLPCSQCKQHAKTYLAYHPITTNQLWVIEFHNQVSIRVNETYGTRKRLFPVA